MIEDTEPSPVFSTKYIAIPSIVGFITDVDDYYSQPWEYTADMFGHVEGRLYSPDASEIANWYWWMSLTG